MGEVLFLGIVPEKQKEGKAHEEAGASRFGRGFLAG